MSETSADYQVGFAKLLPEIWTPAQRCHEGNWDIRSETPTECLTCGANTEGYGPHEMPCPDIRDQGNDTIIVQVMLELHKRKINFVRYIFEQDGDRPFLAGLYACIEDYGRTP